MASRFPGVQLTRNLFITSHRRPIARWLKLWKHRGERRAAKRDPEVQAMYGRYKGYD